MAKKTDKTDARAGSESADPAELESGVAPLGAGATRGRERLQAKLDRKRAQIREARVKLRDIEALLDDADGASPFAPERFPDLPEVAGVTLAAAAAGVKYEDRLDVMLARAEGPALSVAGVFTRSLTRAAPVLWCEARRDAVAEATGAKRPKAIGVVANAGNANAFTGSNGAKATEAVAKAAAKALKLKPEQMFVAATGVIGEPLPAERIEAKLAELARSQSADAWEDAARAIMTTDTFPKAASAEIVIDGARVRIVGVAKGSGMIAPDMATLLSFIFTDARVAQPMLQRILSELAETTFNAVTVDGDTSRSDTVLVAATGAAGHAEIDSPRSPGYTAFRRALERVMRALAHAVVKDGEGCSKFVEVRVEGAKTRRAARAIGRAIANSPLVKTAWAGEDANWGRIVMAVGKSGEAADRDRLSIRYGDHPVAEAGWRAPAYDEAALADYMRRQELLLTVDVGVGSAAASVWTCDLTHGYIAINADYRS